MNNYIKISITCQGDDAEILIAFLGEMGYDGFEEIAGALLAYISMEQFNHDALAALLSKKNFPFSRETIMERNWNEEWEKDFEPVVIGDFCAIRASFHKPVDRVQYDLVITPKMSFGTGHHATTRLMVNMMATTAFEGRSVLDFGTGTGILAILAEKLGARSVLGIDIDPWSISNAMENMDMNDCRAIHIEQNDHIPEGKKYGVILANINKHVILQHLNILSQQLEMEGVLLISGFLSGDLDDIMHAVSDHALKITGKSGEEDWLCLKLEKHL